VAPLEPERQRQLAKDLFNRVWELLESESRTPAEDDEMLHAAHASRYHWGVAGEPVNLARGEWQCSRVYAVLGRAEPALWHGRRSLDLCDEHGLADFDLAYAYEALARAHRVAGEAPEAEAYERLAAEAGEAIADPDDREHFRADVATLR
jgi:hypothetical protein